MMRITSLVFVMWVSALLLACGEKPQSIGGVKKGDAAAYQGADNKFVAPGWKVGDKTSWEQALKARMRNSQNEYSKIGPPSTLPVSTVIGK